MYISEKNIDTNFFKYRLPDKKGKNINFQKFAIITV